MPSIFHSEELSLLLSSYLGIHSCWCVRGSAKHVFSSDAMPRLRRALAWRRELSSLFVVFEVVLSVAPEPLSLREVRDSIATFTGTELRDERLGQVLSLARGMLQSCALSGGVSGLSQHCDDGSKLSDPPLALLLARLERFENTLAFFTECFARDDVPQQAIPVRHSSGRRLSRQPSVTIPKNLFPSITDHELDQRLKNHQRALGAMKECEKWQSIVRGAQCALSILEQCSSRGDIVSVDRVQQVLTCSRSNLRPSHPLLPGLVPASLLLLISRTLGGLRIHCSMKPGRNARFFFQPFDGVSSVTSKRSLQRELCDLQGRHQQFCTTAKRAFIEMLPGSSSLANGGSCGGANQRKRLRRTESAA